MAWHAQLSASAAHRWINCPGSIRLSEEAEETEGSASSEAADRGTAAHHLAEICVSQAEIPETYLGCYIEVTPDGDTHFVEAPGLCHPDSRVFEVDEKMADGVQVYVDAVENAREEMSDGWEEFIEVRLTELETIFPLLGGTADYYTVEPFGWAHLIDYKNGYWAVEADSAQLKKYAVGIMLRHPDCEGVIATICQPNASHEGGAVRSIEYSAAELAKFAEELRIAAEATQAPNAELRAGTWCRFCPALTICPEAKEEIMRQANIDFDDDPPEHIPLPDGEDNAELGQLRKWLPIIDTWIKAVDGKVRRELEAGRAVPGAKLVRGKPGNRKWGADEDAIVKAIKKVAGVVKADCYSTPVLLSPAQMEKLGPSKTRKDVKEAVNELVTRAEGGLTVADEEDGRPAVDPIAEAGKDFDNADEG